MATDIGRITNHCASMFGAKVLMTMNAPVARRLPAVIAWAEKCSSEAASPGQN